MTSIEQRDVQSVLAGIDDLLPLIAKRAQATEDLRRLPDETVAELDEVGFFKLLQPEQWGGLQCDPTVFYEAVRRIATACGSTGWVSSIIGVHNWHLALFDQQAQEEVWGDDPDRARLLVVRADGRGHRGRRRLPRQRLVELVVRLRPRHVGVPRRPGDQGRQAGRLRQLPDPAQRVPHRRRLARGRPARHRQQHLVVKDVFVPRHRFLSYKSMNDRTAGGLQTNTAPVYKMPWGTVHPTTISAPIVGMAYGAYDAHVEHQGKRVRAAFAGEKAKDDPFAKVRIAEAASDIDAAWRQLIGNVGDEYALLKADKEIPFELRARARRDQVRATGRAIASIDRLFEASGATALNNDAPVQRFWRDAHAGRVHAANDPERAYLIFGNNEFGLPPQDTMV